jgi:3-hydroxybutyryl-CoA dehydrogenase
VSGERVAVVGAGLMGHGIAQVFAAAGRPVAVWDPDPVARTSVAERVSANLRATGRGQDALERIHVRSSLEDAVGDADVVIEAAPEDLALKQSLFERLDQLAPTGAMLATNTSVMSVGEIGARARRRERVLGTHWWNPPYLIPLVEVVQAEATGDEVVRRMLDLLAEVGKTPVHVRRDVPGFVGNRLQHALWREAIAIVAGGICDAETVDTVVKQSFGRRLGVLGPLENADLVGLDLTLAIHDYVLPDLDRTPGPSPLLRDKVARGELGMKTGSGFRHWPPDQAAAIRQRLLRFLVEGGTAQRSAGN